MEAQFVRNISFRGDETKMTGPLQVINGVLFTLELLVEGGPEKSFMQYFYEIELPGYAASDRVNVGPDDDDKI